MYRNISKLLIVSAITLTLSASNQTSSALVRTQSKEIAQESPLDAHIPVRDLQHIVLGYLQQGWDWALKTVIRVPNNPLLITYLLEQNHLACASKNGSISFYDLITHKVAKTIYFAKECTQQQLHSPNQHTTQNQLHALTTLGPDYLACASSQGIQIWHIADIPRIGKPIINLARRTRQSSHFETSSLAYNPEQQLLASSLTSEKIQIWALCDKKSAMQDIARAYVQMRCVPGEARELAFSPDGNYLASGGLSNHAISIWDSKTGARMKSIILTDIPRLFVSAITSIVWLPDQRIIAGIHNHQCIWDLSDINNPRQTKKISDPDALAQVHQLLPVERSNNTVALINDVSKKRIAVYNLTTGWSQNMFAFHDGKINHVALSPDGAYCAAACEDQTIKIWENTAHAVLALYKKQEQNNSTINL